METKPSHESYTEYEYYDVPPTGMIGTHLEHDNFDPEGEYVIDQMPHVQKHMQDNLRAPTTGQSRTPRTIQQDVYDEDGYTLARHGAHDDINVPERPKTNDSPNQSVKSSNKKFWFIGIGVLFSSLLVGGVIGIFILSLGNIHYHEKLQ